MKGERVHPMTGAGLPVPDRPPRGENIPLAEVIAHHEAWARKLGGDRGMTDADRLDRIRQIAVNVLSKTHHNRKQGLGAFGEQTLNTIYDICVEAERDATRRNAHG